MSSNSSVLSVSYKSLTEFGFFPYYRVGNDGTVWSCRVKGNIKISIGPWWQLRSGKCGKLGYRSVVLFSDSYPKGRSYLVHHLVLRAFVGERPPGLECRHLDGNPQNNQVSNLCWGTRKENIHDQIRHGTHSCGPKHAVKTRGSRHGCAKLTEEDITAIRAEYIPRKVGSPQLAKKYGVASVTIQRIVNYQGWKHI